MNTMPAWYWCALGALLGATIASFLGVVLERVPRGLSLNGRSRCACGRQLAWHENVPIAGWLRTRGTTPCCRQRLPRTYLAGEAAGTLLLGGLGLLAGPLGIAGGAVAAIVIATGAAHLRRHGTRRTDDDGGH